MPTKTNVTGLILSGGRGTRMNGLDKGLVLFRGRPLISHVIDRIKPQVNQLWVNCNRSLDDYLKLGCPLLTDTESDFQGPLRGILSIAGQFSAPTRCSIESKITPESAVEQYCMVVPCDTPFLPLNLVSRLQHHIGDHSAAYASTTTQVQPLVLLLRPQVIHTIPKYLQDGGRSVMGWLALVDAIAVSFSPTNTLSGTQSIGHSSTKSSAKSGKSGNTGTKHVTAGSTHQEDYLNHQVDAFYNINDLASLNKIS